jgi:hypothetical protein
LHAKRDAPNARRKAGADRRPGIAVGRTQHTAAARGGKPGRHSSGARHDDAVVNAGAPPRPLKAAARRGHAFVESIRGGGDTVLAIGRIIAIWKKAKPASDGELGLPE